MNIGNYSSNMIGDSNIFDESFLPAQLKKQNFKLAIAISFILIMIAILGVIFTYVVNDPIGSAFVLGGTILVCFPFIIIQMLCLHKYLGNFRNGEKAQYFMKYLIATTLVLLILSFIAIFIGFAFEIYTIIICFIPQFLVGWQLVKLNTKGNDFVGGFSFLGPIMCTSVILFPLVILIPILVGYIFIKANRYAEQYGFSND
ncbi:MAG: hypothetical protein ACK5M3_04690 [Dysgonomonas sp.]